MVRKEMPELCDVAYKTDWWVLTRERCCLVAWTDAVPAVSRAPACADGDRHKSASERHDSRMRRMRRNSRVHSANHTHPTFVHASAEHNTFRKLPGFIYGIGPLRCDVLSSRRDDYAALPQNRGTQRPKRIGWPGSTHVLHYIRAGRPRRHNVHDCSCHDRQLVVGRARFGGRSKFVVGPKTGLMDEGRAAAYWISSNMSIIVRWDTLLD